MRYRAFCLFLAAILIISLCGCSNDESIPANGTGTRDLDMRIDYCAADAGPLGSTGYGCENPELAEWDGRRSITIVHQTSGDIACKIDLDRQ